MTNDQSVAALRMTNLVRIAATTRCHGRNGPATVLVSALRVTVLVLIASNKCHTRDKPMRSAVTGLRVTVFIIVCSNVTLETNRCEALVT